MTTGRINQVSVHSLQSRRTRESNDSYSRDRPTQRACQPATVQNRLIRSFGRRREHFAVPLCHPQGACSANETTLHCLRGLGPCILARRRRRAESTLPDFPLREPTVRDRSERVRALHVSDEFVFFSSGPRRTFGRAVPESTNKGSLAAGQPLVCIFPLPRGRSEDT